jgi:hypothetical protein
MKKLAFILSLFTSLSSYAISVSHTPVPYMGEVAYQLEVTDEDFPPYYYDADAGGYPSEGYSYTWHTDEGHISNAEKPTFFFATSGEHTVHLMLTPRKKGDDFLKVYTTVTVNVDPLHVSSTSNGNIIDMDMYLDGEARSGDKIYIVVPLNSCMTTGLHNYKVGYDDSKLEFSSVLTQSNLSFSGVTPLAEEVLGAPLNRTVNFSYNWDTYRDDVAAVIEFNVLATIEVPIVLKFHRSNLAQCDSHSALEFASIGGPYDPNYKVSSISKINVFEEPSKKVSTTEVLYTINFQNIGIAPVDSITIYDVLPDYLNFVSFEGSSEPAILVNTSVLGDTVKWVIAPNADIKGTNESPSQPEPSTKGWVRFRAEIAKEQNIIYDTCYCLANTASIYFDSLSAIVTAPDVIIIGDSLCFVANSFGNSYADTFCDEASAPYAKVKLEQKKEESSFTIYPNPFESSFQLKGDLENIKTLEVFNTLGQKLISQTNYNNAIHLDNYPDGLYFVRISTNSGQQVLRVKKH